MADSAHGRYLSAGLRPLASITVRQFARGSGLRNAATPSPPHLLAQADHILLFIHGYNNSSRQAATAYDTFRRRAGELPDVVQVGFFWPGEAMPRRFTETSDPGFISTGFSLLTYTRQVAVARNSADLLADRIQAEVQHRGAVFAHTRAPLRKMRVSIVAHSLGCRVALEMLNRFVGTLKSNLQFPLVAMMAAAVPKGLVGKSGTLRRALEHPQDVLVYSSPNDEALGVAFRLFGLAHVPLGRLFSRGSQEALGLSGSERSQNIHRRHGKRRHGQYWGDAEIAEEVEWAIKTGKVKQDLARKLSIPERYVDTRF